MLVCGLGFYSLIWSIWNIWNRIMFCQETFSDHACLELFRYHFTWWVKRVLGDSAPTIADINRCQVVLLPLPHGHLLTITSLGTLLQFGLSRLTLMSHSPVVILKVGLKVSFVILRALPFCTLGNRSVLIQPYMQKSSPSRWDF